MSERKIKHLGLPQAVLDAGAARQPHPLDKIARPQESGLRAAWQKVEPYLVLDSDLVEAAIAWDAWRAALAATPAPSEPLTVGPEAQAALDRIFPPAPPEPLDVDALARALHEGFLLNAEGTPLCRGGAVKGVHPDAWKFCSAAPHESHAAAIAAAYARAKEPKP